MIHMVADAVVYGAMAIYFSKKNKEVLDYCKHLDQRLQMLENKQVLYDRKEPPQRSYTPSPPSHLTPRLPSHLTPEPPVYGFTPTPPRPTELTLNQVISMFPKEDQINLRQYISDQIRDIPEEEKMEFLTRQRDALLDHLQLPVDKPQPKAVNRLPDPVDELQDPSDFLNSLGLGGDDPLEEVKECEDGVCVLPTKYAEDIPPVSYSSPPKSRGNGLDKTLIDGVKMVTSNLPIIMSTMSSNTGPSIESVSKKLDSTASTEADLEMILAQELSGGGDTDDEDDPDNIVIISRKKKAKPRAKISVRSNSRSNSRVVDLDDARPI